MKYGMKETIDEAVGVVIRAMECAKKYPVVLGTPPMGSYNKWMLAETLKGAVIAIVGKEMKPYIQVLNELRNQSETDQELLLSAVKAFAKLDERWKEMLLDSKRELDDIMWRITMLEEECQK